MGNNIVYYKIYEMKGIVAAMDDLSNENEEFYHPSIDRLKESIDEITEIIEGETINGTEK